MGESALMYLFIVGLFRYIIALIVVKILIKDGKLRPKEVVYNCLAAVVVAIIRVNSAQISPLFYIFVTMVFLAIYLYRSRLYHLKKMIILVFTAMIITCLADQFIILFSHVLQIYNNSLELRILFYIFRFALPVIPAILLVKVSGRLRSIINQNQRIQTVLLCAVMFFYIAFHASIAINTDGWLTDYRTDILLINIFLFAFVLLISSISFSLFARSLEDNYEIKRQQDEQRNLEYYMDEIEQQYATTRKFAHDYQNILSSLHNFIEEEDWGGLRQYYTSKIEVASETITKKSFALEGLSKVKVREIKSILAAKLMMAQNMGIESTFEASDEIDSIPADSVALVRMLGIIMDNAIEELAGINGGKLLVGCFKAGNGVTFVVQNTCRPNMPQLYQLKQPGFSTKGEARGLGLKNLSEIVDSYPNIALNTSIVRGNFIQKIVIGGA